MMKNLLLITLMITSQRPNLAKKIPVVERPFHSFLKNKIQNSIFSCPTNSSEILKLVNNFKEKRSAGHNEVSNFLLKNIIHENDVPLEHIFNLAMSQGAVPDVMKLAKVVPIFKKGDPLDSCNYYYYFYYYLYTALFLERPKAPTTRRIVQKMKMKTYRILKIWITKKKCFKSLFE